MTKPANKFGSRNQRGFTLVELMVALVLGLILTGAVLSAFIANRRVYAASESLGRVQENARAAFELMSRDAREAGGNACNSKVQPVSTLNNPVAYPFADFMGGLSGTDGTAGGMPRDTVVFKSATDAGAQVDGDNPSNVNILTLTSLPDVKEDDIVMVCDPERATIFQVTKSNPSVHNDFKIQTSKNKVPGNATNCMLGDVNGDGKDNDCQNGAIKTYAYGCQGGEAKGNSCLNGTAPAFFAKLRSISWYIAAGSKAGSSLYRRIDGLGVVNGDEVAEGVTGMELEYLVDNDTYVTATKAQADSTWTQVRAVRMTLSFEGEDTGTVSDATGVRQGIVRKVSHVVALRNRINE